MIENDCFLSLLILKFFLPTHIVLSLKVTRHLLWTVLGKMPLGKMPPGKVPPRNKPPRKITPRKIAPQENCTPVPLKKVFCKAYSCYGIS